MNTEWRTAVRQALSALLLAWDGAVFRTPVTASDRSASTPGDPDGAGAESRALQIAVRVRLVDILMQGRTEVLFSVLNAGLVNAILWRFYPVWVTVLWLGVFILVHLERIRMRADYRSASAAVRAEPRWRRRLEENGFWAGCLWGAVASVFILTRDPAVHAFVVFVLGGMAAGAVIVTAADLPTMCAFMAACVVIPVAILLTRGAAADIRLGSMLAIFAVALAMMGCAIHAWIVQNLRLRMTQDRLASDLLASQSAMEEAEAIAEVGRWDSDAPSGVITWSDEMYRIFGVERSNFTPSVAAIRGRVHPDDRVDAKWQHEPATESGSRKGVVHRLVMDDGTVKYVHQQSRIDHDAAGAIVRIHGTVQDITEQKSLEARLEFNATVLRAEIESSESGGMVVDAEGSMILFNSKVAEIWGISIADLEANDERGALQSVASIIVNRKAFEQRIQHLYEHPEEDSHDELQTVDGRTIERYTVSLRDDREKYLGRAWFFTDVTERLRAEALALRSARADVLTGLANRGVFIEALEQAIGGARRGGAGFAVIYLDLDHFKDVNDGLGHAAGDLLLTVAADRMRATIREVDTLARFGGDEFALLAAHISDPATAAGLADKLIKVLSEPFEIAGRRVVAGASAGIDIYGPGSDQAETLLGHADIALYQAKADGRGRYRFFTPAIDIETRARVTLGGELREAIEADQLFLVYQPQVGLENCHVCGVEALVRWNHPTRGLLGPYLFIPLAEQTGLIAKLGEWVLWTACRQAKLWLDAGIMPRRMCVNLSALQFRAPFAVEADILAALAATGLPPERLELELTESVLISGSREVGEVLSRLHLAGVGIAIDDFGTGYSSIEYLRRFPVDRIKIAQNFVRRLETSPRDAAIVKATIGLARALGVQAIAEGVEVKEQFDILKAWRCPEVQGYYFARPLTAEVLVPLLTAGGRLKPRATPDDAECNLAASGASS